MNRDLQRLEAETFDLLVVGGGIYGLATARDAAQRGLSVALLEKDDFSAATSGNSLKIIHGGLRYLQHADLKRMRESIRERRALLATAPHLVHPLACLMPTVGHGVRSRPVMAAALLLNELISLDRNATRDPARRLRRSRILSPSACRDLSPDWLPSGCTGGALWYDAQMTDSDRLALGLALSAWEEGAAVVNHLPVRGLLTAGDRVAGVLAEDRESGARLTVRARLTVNATGPWSAEFLALDRRTCQPTDRPLSLAMNVVLRRPLVARCALAVAKPVNARDPQVRFDGGTGLLFLTPWQGCCIVGTTHLAYDGTASAFRLAARDVEAFLEEVNRAYPPARLTADDVALVHAGLMPVAPAPRAGGDIVVAKRYRIIDHGRSDARPGLVSVVGVKWTTARDVAEKVVDLAFRLLGHQPPPARSASTPLPGGDIDDMARFLGSAEADGKEAGLAPASARRLAERYGTRWRALLAHAHGRPELLAEVAPGAGVLGIEILHAVRQEMARTLADVVRRRSDLGTAGRPAPAALTAVGRLVAAELGWDDHRLRRENDEVARLYDLPAC
jgi:glycerol-3-phosphate dehydrogenase